MTEHLLQFIWQYRYFNLHNLHSTQNEPLQIIHPGNLNTHQGPDFLNAKIKVGNTVLAGSIELHLKSTDWLDHKHSNDKNYNNVILHVVWEHNKNIGLAFPVLELQHRVSSLFLDKYAGMMKADTFIPCENHIGQLHSLTIRAWKDRAAAERLMQKAAYIRALLQQNQHHWEETFWWILARNFGLPQNADAFEAVAKSLPLSILAKHKFQQIQIEALLLGQAGLLHKPFKESYPQMLKKEYVFLQKKYQLQPIPLPLHFLRMRPANFPTVRLAQLAGLIHKSVHLFSKVKEAASIQELVNLLQCTANDYWNYHYVLDKESGTKPKTSGKQLTENVILNTVIPVLYAYGLVNSSEEYKSRAVSFAEKISAEKNTITARFRQLGVSCLNAYDSQALIYWKKNYCNEKKCLCCTVGNKILKPEKD